MSDGDGESTKAIEGAELLPPLRRCLEAMTWWWWWWQRHERPQALVQLMPR